LKHEAELLNIASENSICKEGYEKQIELLKKDKSKLETDLLKTRVQFKEQSESVEKQADSVFVK